MKTTAIRKYRAHSMAPMRGGEEGAEDNLHDDNDDH